MASATGQALRDEPSLYQSPLSHQSVSSFGSPSQATPTQLTPQGPPDAAAADRNNLLASIRASRAHLKNMVPGECCTRTLFHALPHKKHRLMQLTIGAKLFAVLLRGVDFFEFAVSHVFAALEHPILRH